VPKPDKPERDPKTGLSGNYKLQIPNYKKITNSKPQITNNKQERLRKEGKKRKS
jgi:hypothetical protein